MDGLVEKIFGLLGLTGTLSSEVSFAIGAGLVFVIFCVFLVGLSSVFGRWFR